MKVYEKWAREFATHQPDCTCNGAQTDMRRYMGFVAGFRAAREKVAAMIESFNNPNFNAVPFLIRAIGEGEESPEAQSTKETKDG